MTCHCTELTRNVYFVGCYSLMYEFITENGDIVYVMPLPVIFLCLSYGMIAMLLIGITLLSLNTFCFNVVTMQKLIIEDDNLQNLFICDWHCFKLWKRLNWSWNSYTVMIVLMGYVSFREERVRKLVCGNFTISFQNVIDNLQLHCSSLDIFLQHQMLWLMHSEFSSTTTYQINLHLTNHVMLVISFCEDKDFQVFFLFT